MPERTPAWVREQMQLYREQLTRQITEAIEASTPAEPVGITWHQMIDDIIQADERVPEDEIWLRHRGNVVARLTGIRDMGEGRFEVDIPEHTVGYGLLRRLITADVRGLSISEPLDVPYLCPEAPQPWEDAPAGVQPAARWGDS